MQNVFFADVLGGAGMMAAAKVPIRRRGDGFTPAPGADGTADWLGWIPTELLPAGAPTPGGYLANANNRVVGPGYPFFISRDWDPSYRADRLTALLEPGGADAVADHQRIQLDIHSPMAERLLPLLLAAVADDARLTEAAGLLARWDRRMSRDRPEPLLFAAWLRALGAAMIAPAVGDLLPGIGGTRAPLIERSFTNGGPWCAIGVAQGERRCRDLAVASLVKALDLLTTTYGKDMNSWRWGNAHQARHAHLLFGRVPVLKDLFDIVAPTDGGDDTINRGAMARGGSGEDPAGFAHVHGPGFRAVYDLGDLANSRMIIATGQSGHRLSPHYGDLNQRWRDGAGLTLSGTPAQLAAAGARSLTLTAP